MLAPHNQESASVKSALEWASMQPGLSNADLLAIHQPFQRYFDNLFYFPQAPWSDKVTGPAHLNKKKKKTQPGLTIGQKKCNCRLNQV